jgi:hypothetical protein
MKTFKLWNDQVVKAGDIVTRIGGEVDAPSWSTWTVKSINKKHRDPLLRSHLFFREVPKHSFRLWIQTQRFISAEDPA